MGQLAVFEGISEMRKRSTEGIVEVNRDRLRPRSPDADFSNGEFLEPTSIY
ncbi:hypothetical protein [Cyclobacterium roseum]|uniref:hypothetical protein n=1 Tax=Cyclobacterium roseum TaxID=2666137 RepID=UPI001390D3C3|nr:hypothetical protein [Cyclobacterium roseum]